MRQMDRRGWTAISGDGQLAALYFTTSKSSRSARRSLKRSPAWRRKSPKWPERPVTAPLAVSGGGAGDLAETRRLACEGARDTNSYVGRKSREQRP